ncbi:MAG TPA: M23 family metallopeptidase [Vicinamibacterales bacterium]|nr:M23 family metallopeptidase [Vicinamibacterales bacterium]
MSRRLRLLGVACAVAFGCASGPTEPSAASAACDPESTSANAVLPILGRPFDGAFPIGNFFDHDKPIDSDANGYVLTLCGARDTTQVDGHPGYDWRMPEGTPLNAVADAVVLTAGLVAPDFCPQLNRTVQALRVQLVHTAPTGESYVSVYGHLSRVDVQEGVSVSEGTVIGLSGNTGCSGTPHLHFGVARNVAGRYVLIDPYGWHSPMGDPWELDSRGAASVWLWKGGAAPSLR